MALKAVFQHCDNDKWPSLVILVNIIFALLECLLSGPRSLGVNCHFYKSSSSLNVSLVMNFHLNNKFDIT